MTKPMKPTKRVRKPKFEVGQHVMIYKCEGVISAIIPFIGSRGSMLEIRVATGVIPCYRKEVRPLTAKERGIR